MHIRPAIASDIPGLAATMLAAVADGASIGFMAGFGDATARAFWQDRLAAMARGDLHILIAETGGTLAGTVTLNLATPPNQPHRADVQKMIVAPAAIKIVCPIAPAQKIKACSTPNGVVASRTIQIIRPGTADNGLDGVTDFCHIG